jgi:hypothetical protein
VAGSVSDLSLVTSVDLLRSGISECGLMVADL